MRGNEAASQFNAELLEAGRFNDNNFFVDQLALALQTWGLRQARPLHLRLGYILSNGSAYLLPDLYPNDPNTIVVWIHSTSRTGRGGNTLHHFSGVGHP